MERWQDSRQYLILLSILFVLACGGVYFASVATEASHPLRNTALFAAGVVGVCAVISLLWAAMFVPLFKLIIKASGKEPDAQPDE